MDEEQAESGDNVDVTVEITGRYDDVVPKLQTAAPARETLEAVTTDLSILLDTVIQLDGGTRSAIADQLPADMNRAYDAEAVVDALQVLDQYDLVVLEGNTWKPGPTIDR